MFQNYVALYFELYWKQENVTDIKFWCFIKLKDLDFQWEKNKILCLISSRVMALTSEREIAADNGMCHTQGIWIRYYTVKRRIKHKFQALELWQINQTF